MKLKQNGQFLCFGLSQELNAKCWVFANPDPRFIANLAHHIKKRLKNDFSCDFYS